MMLCTFTCPSGRDLHKIPIAPRPSAHNILLERVKYDTRVRKSPLSLRLQRQRVLMYAARLLRLGMRIYLLLPVRLRR
jgi:hypothetical protein